MARKKRATNRIHAAGAIALVAGLVLALSFLPEATGLPRVLGRMQRVALGDAAWVIPLAGILGGIALLRASDWSRFGRRTTGAALIVLASLAAYHARVPKGAEWSIGISGRGAGVVGGALWWALRGGLGDAGSWLALVLGAIGGMLLWSNISLANAIKGLLSALQWTGRGLANVIRTTWQAAEAGATAVLGLIASLLGAVVDAVWGVEDDRGTTVRDGEARPGTHDIVPFALRTRNLECRGDPRASGSDLPSAQWRNAHTRGGTAT